MITIQAYWLLECKQGRCWGYGLSWSRGHEAIDKLPGEHVGMGPHAIARVPIRLTWQHSALPSASKSYASAPLMGMGTDTGCVA